MLLGLALFFITFIIQYLEINIDTNIGKFISVVLILGGLITVIALTERAMNKQNDVTGE